MLPSLLTNIISNSFGKFIVLGFLFCCLGSFNAWAQEERTMNHADSPSEYEEMNEQVVSPVVAPKEIKQALPTKHESKENLSKQRGEKDAKSEGISTLSFNLFLYVVDRFKEDN